MLIDCQFEPLGLIVESMGQHTPGGDRCSSWASLALLAACCCGCAADGTGPPKSGVQQRGFRLPLPLFSSASAWRQEARGAAVLPASDQQILVTYRVLRGDRTDQRPLDNPPTTTWPFMDVGYDDFTVPIFRGATARQDVAICDYDGRSAWPSPKFASPQRGGPVSVPAAVGTLRPNGPRTKGADGHLVIFELASHTEYDFWQATTQRSGPCASLGGGREGPTIVEAGAVDFFDVKKDGSNPDTVSSAHAVGTALLAGLIVPEDVESGVISHALAFAMPGLRNLAPDPTTPLATDYFYPASTTETDFYSVNPHHLAAGQRIRLKTSIVDDAGAPLDLATLTPITQMFLRALQTYGAYLVDGADGLTFYAEDYRTAKLSLADREVNALLGQPGDASLPAGKTNWQTVMDRLNLELERIPLAYDADWQDGADPARATYDVANFDVVEPPQRPR